MTKILIPVCFLIWAGLVFLILIKSGSVTKGNLLFDVNSITSFSFLETNKLYLLLHAVTFFPVFLLSFDQKVAYYKKWKSLFPAIFITACFFITWDVLFTEAGVWGFNEKYILPYKFGGLPLEEILFFFTVPYATVFIYECLKSYWKTNFDFFPEKNISFFLCFFFLLLSFLKIGHLYTATTFLLAAGLLMINILFFDKKTKSYFYFAFAISLLPFLLINGTLTGAFTGEPVVVYNPEEYLGLRLITIPADDAVYSFVLILMNINIFESFAFYRKKNN